MKAYIAIKHYSDFKNREVVDSISLALESQGYETICFIRDFEGGGTIHYDEDVMMKMVFEKISECDLFVVDISEKGVGLGIASGYAYAKGIPVVAVAKTGSDIPTTLKGISREVLFYDGVEDIKNVLSAV